MEGVPPTEAESILQRRFADGTYAAPTRGGLSYTLAPVHRACVEPASSDRIGTFSFPHYMPYAPHVPTGHLGTMGPRLRAGALDHGGSDTGPHGQFDFMVQRDQAERIRAEQAELLNRLCELHDGRCLPER